MNAVLWIAGWLLFALAVPYFAFWGLGLWFAGYTVKAYLVWAGLIALVVTVMRGGR